MGLLREDGHSAGSRGEINWQVFAGSVAVLVCLIAPLALFPEDGRVVLTEAFDYLTTNFGVLYIAAGIFALVYLLFLATGRHRHLVMGRSGEAPQFSRFSWGAMLFCGGIGTSVLYWGSIEWAHYYTAPPFGVEPLSAEAMQWAVSYPIFHWGPIGWAFYCLPGVAMGYVYYQGDARTLRLSEACAAVTPQSWRPMLDPVIDMIFVIGLVGACSTGIGLAVPLIGTLVSQLFGLDRDGLGFTLDVIVIISITALFSASAWLGLEKGIKRLSNANAWLAFALIGFVLFAGPTRYIVEMGIESLGHLLQNFVRMSTWTDSGSTSNFVESWTVFYWAWWLALGPFMGVFIAKISRGRSLQEIIFGCLGYGTLGCVLFFVVLGNYAAHVTLNGSVDLLASLAADDAPGAIVNVLTTLPGSTPIIFLFAVVCIIFAATSYDSAAYTLATAASDELPEDAHPSRGHRIFWALLLGALPITLISMGGLRPLQSAVTLASVPLLIIMVVMVWSLHKNLRDHV